MKVFLAHAKGSTDLFIQELCSGVRHWYLQNGEEVEVVPGVDDFLANIGSEGTFDAWARSVPTRSDSFTGQRIYSAVIVPGREMGKATALIVETALAVETPVFSVEQVGAHDVELYEADGVHCVDPKDFFRGWELSVPGL